MYDLISRRVAIDKIRAERNKSSTPKEWHDGMNMAIFYLTHLQPLKELSEWKADFKEYINALNMPKDDYDGIMEYIDEVPSVQPEQRRIPITEESVIQAGYEGKEVRFRLRGRLFAIRELAQ